MDPVTVTLLIAVAAVLLLVPLWLRWRKSRHGVFKITTDELMGAIAREHYYVIQTADNGPGYDPPEMRYRWEVWRSSHEVWMLLLNEGSEYAPEPDGDGQVIGVTTPYMLGNTPTRTEAWGQAIEWVEGRGPCAIGVVPEKR